MKFIKGNDRNQITLFPTSIGAIIAEDNIVRALDIFVESLDLGSMGFKLDFPENGRPAYHPSTLLKLYIYGYMNKIRSSRMLERECSRNIELMWLLGQLAPDHNTINTFRKDNPKAIKRVFRATVKMAKNHELIGGTLLAGDSTKLRAQNSKKHNYNQKKIQRHIDYIDKKVAQYNQLLSEEDNDVDSQQIQQELDKQQKRKENYNQLKERLEATGEDQLSTSDPESRQMIIRNNITEVVYNLQSTVDAKHYIPIDYKVTNNNDTKAMGTMLRRAKTSVGTNQFTALYDKGYHTGSEIKTASDLGIETLVAIPRIGRASQAPDPKYNAEHFQYNHHRDTYLCPQGNPMVSNGSWYKSRNYRFKQYKTKACKGCPVRAQCTTAKNGKILQRSEFHTYVEQNAKRVANNKETYKKRQAIVEHSFGTIKRQWGFDHVMTKKTKQSAAADIGFIFIAYNLKRIWNSIGMNPFERLFYKLLTSILRVIKRFQSILGNLNSTNQAYLIFQLYLPTRSKMSILVPDQ